jgi:SSS family solute:Na+ symporter
MAILPAYLVVTILIGWVSRRTLSGANDFLNASRSLPLWVVAAAFLAANSGALEIVGLSAMAAQYGVQAFHFYWIGAIPAMVFLGAFMMPIYMRSGVQSLPEYLERRFDARVRLINSWFILVMGTALSGIGLYAMAEILHVVFGWTFTAGAFLAAGVVLIYVILGGLRATIYNEVFQLLIIVLGLLPLLRHPTAVYHYASQLTGAPRHLWLGRPTLSPTANLDQFGVIAGLGFVLSFSYWCTDFVQI